MIDILLSSWQTTLQNFHVDPGAANKVFLDLVGIYAESNRHYHNIQHISQVLSTIDILKNYAQDLPAIQLAAWFHDAVYHTQLKDNEEKSAIYAQNVLLGLGIPAHRMIKITNLILNTKYHQAEDIDSQILLDADLAILGTNSIAYQEYAHAIRQEYAWVEETEYIAGRKLVLERFLQRPFIYYTSVMRESAEELARLNIQREIFALGLTSGTITNLN
jgi:predicted metal-dependent HD superfamily phosphohydrolase